MESKIIKTRYNGLLKRAFERDFQIFLFSEYKKKNRSITNKSILDNYLVFLKETKENEYNLYNKQYNWLYQLQKDKEWINEIDDIEPASGKSVGELNTFMNQIFKEKDVYESGKKLYAEKKFIRYEDLEDIIIKKGELSCEYCGINEDQLEALIKENGVNTKRLSTRGRTLEIDRKNSNYTYTKENIAICCYWCNNAKSDEFTHEEFLKVGMIIKDLWANRIKDFKPS